MMTNAIDIKTILDEYRNLKEEEEEEMLFRQGINLTLMIKWQKENSIDLLTCMKR